jgi:phytoene dehydrogenase-like protein
MRIAIVGAGVSGLVAAYLAGARHEVTVFEAAGYAGGHTNTIRVDTADETHQVDTGFIVFNDRNHPSFQRLLDRLGVESQPSTMTFSVSDGRGDFEYNGSSPNGLFAKRAHLITPWFHRMVADLARFNRSAPGRVLRPPWHAVVSQSPSMADDPRWIGAIPYQPNCVCAVATTSAIRRCRWPTPFATASQSSAARGPRGRSACSRSCARSGCASTR